MNFQNSPNLVILDSWTKKLNSQNEISKFLKAKTYLTHNLLKSFQSQYSNLTAYLLLLYISNSNLFFLFYLSSVSSIPKLQWQ